MKGWGVVGEAPGGRRLFFVKVIPGEFAAQARSDVLGAVAKAIADVMRVPGACRGFTVTVHPLVTCEHD